MQSRNLEGKITTIDDENPQMLAFSLFKFDLANLYNFPCKSFNLSRNFKQNDWPS